MIPSNNGNFILGKEEKTSKLQIWVLGERGGGDGVQTLLLYEIRETLSHTKGISQTSFEMLREANQGCVCPCLWPVLQWIAPQVSC